MAQTQAKVKVEGTKPALFHTFPMDTFSIDKKKEGKVGDNPNEWKDTVLMLPSRQLYFMNTYFQASIAEGGKEIKAGRGNISKKVSGTLMVDEPKIPLDDLFVPEEENLTKNDTDRVYLDVRAVVNPMTKGRNLRYRVAAKAGWTCSFTVTWDDRILSKDQIKLCIENAGLLQGVGSGRKLGFGRFKVVDFRLIKD